MFGADVLARDAEAYWAYDSSADRVVVTKSRRALDEHPSFTESTTTEVSPDCVLSLPSKLIDEDDGEPWAGAFEEEDRCYLDATMALLSAGFGYVLTDEQHRELWNE